MGRKKLFEPRGVSVTFGGKFREGFWKKQHVSCVLGMQRGGWRSSQMECGEQERNMCICAGNIGKEDDWTGKVYWSPTEGVS